MLLPARDLDVETETGIGLVRFQAYVLPAREQFSSEERFAKAAGPRRCSKSPVSPRGSGSLDKRYS